jgi:hypothetical protein
MRDLAGFVPERRAFLAACQDTGKERFAIRCEAEEHKPRGIAADGESSFERNVAQE